MLDLFQELRRRKLAHELTDADLLDRYREAKDAAAFETLVRRHGPMVQGVCRRLLRDPAAADDAFQATFLVLLRSASRVRKLGSVGSWLHGVALRTARHALTLATRRRRHEEQYAQRSAAMAAAPEPTPAEELGPWLDEELRRLPEKLRQPLVLCYLEGLSKPQAARRLGLPEGTVSSRLTRGRDRLRQRLLRRGLPAAVVLAALHGPLAQAGVPTVFLQSTLVLAEAVLAGGAAASALSLSVTSLGEQVMHAMAIAKLKFASLLVAGGLITGTAGFLAVGGQPGQDGGTVGRPATARATGVGLAPTGGGGAAARIETKRDAHEVEWAENAQQIHEVLRKPTGAFKGGRESMPLREHLDAIGKQFGVMILLDEKAFREAGNEEVVRDHSVKLGPMPRLTLDSALKQLLGQLNVSASFIVKGDHILILPEDKVTGERLLQEQINYEIREGQTLEQALKALADEHGVTILLDARAEEQGKTPIKGRLRNVPLQVAVRLLAEMAGLKGVMVGNAMFVTTPEHAFTLQQEQDGQILPPGTIGGPPMVGGAGLGGAPQGKRNKSARGDAPAPVLPVPSAKPTGAPPGASQP